MNCKDTQEILFKYLDNDLSNELRDKIDAHLKECVECRFALNEIKKTKDQLVLLRKSPEAPDIWRETMAKIGHLEKSSRDRQRRRPALLAVPVVIIVAFILVIQLFGISEDTSDVISKAYAATEKLTSFRSIKEEYNQVSESDELFHSAHGEIQYTFPNRYQLASEITMSEGSDYTSYIEIIRIDSQVYVNQLYFPLQLDEQWFDEQVPTKEKTLESLDLLIEVEELDEEAIDGIDCYHYIGTIDTEKLIEKLRPKMEKLYTEWSDKWGNTYEDIDSIIERAESNYRAQKSTWELWIGKEDYLIRQSIYISQQLPGASSSFSYKSIAESRYFDFNEDFIIEAPLDESGELLAGWTSYLFEE